MAESPPPPPPADGPLSTPPPADGPPPTPFERERERRRRILLVSVIGGLLIVVPTAGLLASGGDLGLVISFGDTSSEDDAGATEDDGAEPGPEGEGAPEEGEDADEAPEDGETEAGEEPPDIDVEVEVDDAGRPDPDVPGDEQLVRPEVDDLEEPQRAIGDMLLDIEASERVMLAFQLEAQRAFSEGADPDEPDGIERAVRSAALHGLDGLATLRDRLESDQDDPWAEQVRDTYVLHMDSWVRYLEAVADDPDILLGETGRYTVDINRTGGNFTRAVGAQRPDDLPGELGRLADDIVERGFPETDNPQV